ncbi:50S ribosomal protein L14 [Candidatus Bathyarchaeota archaeon]|nr:MAG: 50S ribosomal protein L14 [Candidatus Bathyarchaeota archaeon]RLI32997.1 MAG: 50S ribosomal protein L14 [Candidatus Bathyarchaeota archaeon]
MSKRIKRRVLPRRGLTTGLTTGSVILCADNTGARRLKLVQVVGYKGRKRRLPSAAVGDMIVVSVREGVPEMRKRLFNAVVIRQRKPYRRRDGTWIQFEDNAAIIITPDGEPRGSNIKGPVAREVTERWPKIASIAKTVV